ncbi:MAG: hypothetical protein IPK18_05255 [Sphingobacteriales bacterium]|nr:MAG: hypothetical protein IPK18_05255 [Sphingobacteriales bacterium]
MYRHDSVDSYRECIDKFSYRYSGSEGVVRIGLQTYTATGAYTQVLENALGCDSIVTINVTIENGGSKEVVDTAICSGESVSYYGQTFSSTGTYQIVYPSEEGCTDTLILNVYTHLCRDTIRDTNVIYTTDTICASIDNGMSNIVTTIVDCAGAMNNSGNVYTALEDGCIAITRSGVVGYNLDTLCIVKTDTVTGISDTTVAIISNLPKRDTIRDTNVIITTDTVCVDVELGMNADSIYIVDCAGSMNNSGNVYSYPRYGMYRSR